MSRANDIERQSDLAVMDANEYDQKRRLKRMHERIEDFHEKREEAWHLYVTGQISHEGMCLQLLHAVQDAIEELWELASEEREGEHNEYWKNRDEPEAVIGRLEFEHRQDVIFRDLWDVMKADNYYSESWVERESHRHGVDQKTERERERVVPEDISQSAFLRLKEYLADQHDMKLKFEEIDDSLPMFGYEEVDSDD